MRYTRGEMAGLGAAILAIVAVGAGMTLADSSPHLGQMQAFQAGPTAPAVTIPPVQATSAAVQTAPPAAPANSASRTLVIKRVLPIAGAIRYGEWHWNEAGAPTTGPVVITVDLDARVLSIFRDGYEIGAAAVLVGSQEKPTPLGIFPITEKDANHVSNLYDAPMPYMMRLTNDGVSIHATTVQNGYASHGCIGVPKAFAKKLFDAAQRGDRVYITRGKHVGVGDGLT